MATLSSMVEEWISALNATASAASLALQMDTTSTTTFHNNCAQLVGNNISFQGLGAKAFDNLYTLNEGRAQMAQAKVHDFYNASNNLPKQIEEITSQYDNLNDPGYFTSLNRYGGDIMLQRFLPNLNSGDICIEILQRLRDSFLQHARLDDVLDPVNMSATIYLATNWERGDLMSQVENHYQTVLQGWKNDPQSRSLLQYEVPQEKQDLDTVRWTIQTLVDNMNSQLSNWALALRTLTMTYYSEVLAASKVDQPTVADILYEFNLPEYSNSPVLIYQLSNGGLLIAIKGGTKQYDEQLIRNYMAQYYGNQKGMPQVTILGYKDGTSIAQEIIQQSVDPAHSANPNDILPFNVVNAIMVGGKLPDPGTMPVNYMAYQETPGEQKRPWWQPTPEQLTLMAATAVVGVATDGIGFAVGGEAITGELVAAQFTETFGSLAKEKIIEYAGDLGYNATHPENQTMEEFIAKKIQNSGAYTSADSMVLQLPGQDPMPLQQYVKQQISQGNTVDLKNLNAKFYYHYMSVLPEEPNLDKGILSNDALLGSQFILDPQKMSNTTLGVAPIQGPISPPGIPPGTGN